MFKCEEITTLAEGNSFWYEWLELLNRIRPELRLFGPEWYTIWSRTWGASGRWTGKLRFLTVRDEASTLQGILPLGFPKVGPFSVRSFGGHDQPHRAILAAAACEDAVGHALGEYVARSGWSMLQIGPLVSSLSGQRAFVETLRCRNVFLHRARLAPLAVCDPPETWEQYRQEVLGGKFFRKVAYYERKTERTGNMQIVHYRQPSPVETAQMLDALASIERRSWMMTRDNAKPRFLGDAARSMWAELIEQSLTPNDQLDCWVMSLDGVPVSFCFTLTAMPVRYVIANNFDEAVSDFRTGSTLYRYMMQEGIERGVRRFDFGDSELHYKKYWGATYADTSETLVAFPSRPVGLLLQPALQARRFLQTLRSSLRRANDTPPQPESSDGEQQQPSPQEQHAGELVSTE